MDRDLSLLYKIIGLTHNVQNDTSIEKVECFFNYAKEIGKYPIKAK